MTKNSSRLPAEHALRRIVEVRRSSDIVITNQISSRLWPRLSQHPLDINYNSSTMGGAIPLGLGLALSQPAREVLVLSGDGSLLMSLGSLVTVVGSGATNLSIMLLDNGTYEVTGGQKTAASEQAVDYAGFARAAGFPNVAQFWDLEDWLERLPRILARPGPRFLWLQVDATPRELWCEKFAPIAERLSAFRVAIGN